MTEEVTAANNEATEAVVQAQAQEEEGFAAGFDKAHGKPSTEAKTEAKTEATTEAKPNNEQATTEVKTEAVPAKEEPAPVLIAGMTEAELKAKLGKGDAVEAEVRKAFGKIGEINSALQEIRKGLSAGGSKAGSRKITADMLKRVSEELPGLGDALAQDLAGIFDAPAAAEAKAEAKAEAETKGQTFDADAFEKRLFDEKIAPAFAQIEARINEAAETRLLKSLHPDYVTTVNAPEFKSWLQTLPAERQKEVVESPDAIATGAAITEFKDWNAKAVKAAAAKQKRLEGAITPKGSGAPASQSTQDEDAAFSTGFKQVAGKKA